MTAPTNPAPVPPLVEPRRYDWDETPREAADFDDRWWDARYDTDEED